MQHGKSRGVGTPKPDFADSSARPGKPEDMNRQQAHSRQ